MLAPDHGYVTLTVKKVFSNLRKLAEESGSGSVDRKLQLIAELLTSAKGNEALDFIQSRIVPWLP